MPQIPQPAERRAFGRRETLIHAIARVAGRPPEACIVRNVSEHGALVEFSRDFDPGGPFRLVVEAKGLDVMCEVRRWNGRSLGVEYVRESAPRPIRIADLLPLEDEDGAAPTAPSAPPQAIERPVFVTVVSGDEVRAKLPA